MNLYQVCQFSPNKKVQVLLNNKINLKIYVGTWYILHNKYFYVAMKNISKNMINVSGKK